MNFLDRFTRTHRLTEFQKAKKAARVDVQIESPDRPLPIEDTKAILRYGKKARKAMTGRAPMKWPEGSLHARQTAILKWIESNGGKVNYR